MTITRRKLRTDPTPGPDPLAWKIAEAAKAIGLSEGKFRQLLQDRTAGVPAVRIGSRVLIPRDRLKEWLDSRVGKRLP